MPTLFFEHSLICSLLRLPDILRIRKPKRSLVLAESIPFFPLVTPLSDVSEPPATAIDATNSGENRVRVLPGGPVRGTIRPPGSKSLTNRALMIAALATPREDQQSQRSSRITGALVSEDTQVMTAALRQVGADIRVEDAGTTLVVHPLPLQPLAMGEGNSPASQDPPLDLYIANSGTSVRFLTAGLSAAGGNYRLHGVQRMHQRPIGDLITALKAVVDGSIKSLSPGACPPVEMHSRGWNGRQLRVAGNVSSQFLSGLMMAAPRVFSANANQSPNTSPPTSNHSARDSNLDASSANEDVMTIAVDGELVSLPYVEMTVAVMADFGVAVTTLELHSDGSPQPRGFSIRNTGGYRPSDYVVEPDASAASYFWAAAAITGGRVSVQGLARDALQGDVGFVDVLQEMGCHVENTIESGQPTITVDAQSLP
ncbi:MAG: hypothetical protein AAFN70_03640, partial [Planctomycetota bacterium]